MTNDFISISDGNAFMDKESKLVEMFNSHYTNTVEETSGVSPESYVINTNNTWEIIEGIIRKYKRYPGILKIKNNFVSSITFNFSKAKVADIKLTPFLNKQTLKKQKNTISSKLVKMSANVIDKHLCNIIDIDIEKYNVPDNTKVADSNS